MAVTENEAGPSRPRSTRNSAHLASLASSELPRRASARLASVPVDHPAPSPVRMDTPPGARSGSSTPHEEDTDLEDDGTAEDYEQQRQRRMRENAAIMESLGITAIQASSRVESPPRAPKRRYRKNAAPVFDRSGHILSLPREGEKHRMACVEIPSDRRLRKRIDDGEYQDCEDWWEGEERRWRFGKGQGKLVEGEEEVVSGVGPNFRWRKWRGRKRELEAEQEKLDKLIQEDTRPEVPPGVSAYSLIDGPACHQCRRKSDKEKMTCRNIHPLCRAVFCESCCKRYSYFEFDPDARSFICPLCQKCCNCSNCLRKRNLAHLLEGSKGFRFSALQLRQNLGGGEGDETIQELLDKVMDHDPLPFDRVRLVEKESDIISPELPPLPAISSPPKARKGKKKLHGGEHGKKRGRPKKVEAVGGGEGGRSGLIIKLKIPKAIEPIPIDPSLAATSAPAVVAGRQTAEKEKMYDSDGDTIAGSSSDEEDRRSATDTSAPPAARKPDDNPTVLLPQLCPTSMYRPSFGGARTEPSFSYSSPGAPERSGEVESKLSQPVSRGTAAYQPHQISSKSSQAPSVTPPAYLVHTAPAAITQPSAQPEQSYGWPTQASAPRPNQSFTYNSFTYTSSSGDTTTYESHYQSSGPSHTHAPYYQPIPIPSIQSLIAARSVPPPAPPTHATWQQDHPPPYSQSTVQPLSLQPVFQSAAFGPTHSTQSDWPQNLDILSLAASEARNSPSLEAQANARAGYAIPPQQGGKGMYRYG